MKANVTNNETRNTSSKPMIEASDEVRCALQEQAQKAACIHATSGYHMNVTSKFQSVITHTHTHTCWTAIATAALLLSSELEM